MFEDAARHYRTQQVATATPAELVGMLFDAGMRNLHLARAALDVGDRGGAGVHLVRAQDIVCELQHSLSPEGGELTDQLERLYDFLYRHLIEANLRKDASIVDVCIRVLVPLQTAWNEACLGRVPAGAA